MKFTIGKNKLLTQETIVGDSRLVNKIKKIEVSLWLVFFVIMTIQSVVWYHTLFWAVISISILGTSHIYIKDVSLVDIAWKSFKGSIFQREEDVKIYLGTSISMSIISIGLVIL